MKKISYLILILFLCFSWTVNAESYPVDEYGRYTKIRQSDNNYGVNKKIDMTPSYRISQAKKTPYVDASFKIYDFSNILTADEEKKLKTKIDEFSNKTKIDIVIVTTDLTYSYDKENEDYASDFYDYNDFGINYPNYSGVLLLRNIYAVDPYFNIYTFGDAQLYFTYSRLENILDDIYPDFKGGINYYNGMNTFISRLDKYYDSGKPSESLNKTIDENGFVVEKYSPPIIVLLLISIAASSIIGFIEISKNKMVKKATKATDYLDKASIVYDEKRDVYIRSHTTSQVISSGSSGGSRGGSSGGGHSSGGGRHG